MKYLIGAIITTILIISLIAYSTGWIGVHYTSTVRAAQKDAEREVFEHSQSYIEGKRQTAFKYYKEYQQADESSREGLKNIISQEFASFDEDKYLTGEIKLFIKECKY